jgi:poly-gamma-glutamate capsule biosynthesis protein CapA/YwtB (metallophosphatase superfamily)
MCPMQRTGSLLMTTLFLCGDVMTGRGIDQILSDPADPELHEPYVKDARQYVALAEQEHGHIELPVEDQYLWGFGLEVLRKVDPAVRIINLETAVTTHDTYWKGKGIHYRMSPENIGCLTAARIDCCTLANNHVLDWHYRGLTETLNSLHRVGLKTAGAGSNEEEAAAPAVLTSAAGNRILVFGLATLDSGVSPAWAAAADRAGICFLPDLSDVSFDKTAKTIAAARRNDSDIIVVSIHWGGNWGYAISDDQRAFAHRLIDQAAVDIVHGHSSHHVKGIEVYHGRLILYGCGDLITDYEGISGNETFRGDLGLMYFPQIDPATGALRALRMQPTQMRRLQLCRPSEQDVAWLRNVLNREGRRFGTSVLLGQDGMLELKWND